MHVKSGCGLTAPTHYVYMACTTIVAHVPLYTYICHTSLNLYTPDSDARFACLLAMLFIFSEDEVITIFTTHTHKTYLRADLQYLRCPLHLFCSHSAVVPGSIPLLYLCSSSCVTFTAACDILCEERLGPFCKAFSPEPIRSVGTCFV